MSLEENHDDFSEDLSRGPTWTALNDPTHQPYSSRKYPPPCCRSAGNKGGILATHHPTPFGARLYPIFGRACGAIFFVFLHFRAFQTHFQHFLLLPGTEMCFKTAFLTEMSKIFHISNGKRCHYHCKTLIKGKERRRPEKIRFWLSFLMQKPLFYSLFLLETTGKTSQNV